MLFNPDLVWENVVINQFSKFFLLGDLPGVADCAFWQDGPNHTEQVNNFKLNQPEAPPTHPVGRVKHDNNDENVSVNVREVDPQGTFALDLTYHFHQTQLWNLFFRQGNDRGTQYRSGIYYHSEEQKVVATIFVSKLNLLRGKCSHKFFPIIVQVMTLFLSPVFCFVVKCAFQAIAQNFIKEAQAKYKDKIVVEVGLTMCNFPVRW